MTAKPVINAQKLQEFEDYFSHKNKNIYEVSIKIFKIASFILGLGAIAGFSSICFFSISSSLLLHTSIACASSCVFSFITSKILSRFKINIEKPSKITQEQLIGTLDKYNSKFPSLDPNIYLGKIEKINLDKGSKLFLKADLHGDFFSLIENLKALQKQDILDKDFKISKEYKGKVLIAFLGDYLDRGEHSFETIDLLMKLKINNPDDIVLIKGNHENLETSNDYIHENEKHFYKNKQLCKKLDQFFSSLPLSVFVGSKDEKNRYQYTCLTHGAIDPDIDVNELLNSKKSVMYIEKNKKAALSNRLLNLLPKHLKNKKLSEIKDSVKNLKAFISNPHVVFNKDHINKKNAKQLLSILKVQDFLITYSSVIENERKKNLSSFNWGDIKNSLGQNFSRGAGMTFTPEFIKDYFRAISSENVKVKALRAGHAHLNKSYSLNGKKGFIEILPVAGELECYDRLREPVDRADIITIAPKVKNWKERLIIRQRGNIESELGPEKTFYSPPDYSSFFLPA
jgi:hypothetical protein